MSLSCKNYLIYFSIAILNLSVSQLYAFDIENFRNYSGTVSISGGSAHYPVMKEAKYRIENINPNILVNVKGGGSSLGIKEVGEGSVDIGNSGRFLKEKEKIYNLMYVPLAVDAVAIVVHPSNPINKITSESIQKIYSGKITNWKQLGGKDENISVFDRQDGSGTQTSFIKHILHKKRTVQARIMQSHEEMKIAVSWDKNGIGFISLGYVDKSKTKPLILDGVEASIENTLNGNYAMQRKLVMFVKNDPKLVTPLTQAFIKYLTSHEAIDIIKKNGYIPINNR